MDTFADDIKRGISQKIEANTGFIGQVMRQRREEAEQEKRTKAELSEIEKATQKMRSVDKSYKKIHSRLATTNTNFKIIFALLRIEEKRIAKLHGKPVKKFSMIQTAAAQQKSVDDVLKDNETLPLFDKLTSILDVLKGKLPKGKLPRPGKAPRKFTTIKRIGMAVAAGAGAAVAVSAIKAPPVVQQPPPEPVAPPPSPSAAVVTPPPLPPPAAPPPAAPPPAVTAPAPVVKPPVAAQKPPEPAAKVIQQATPSTRPDSVAESLAPSTPQTTGGELSLTSTVKLADPKVSLAGLNGMFEKRAAAMATDFKQKTGKNLTVTSGVRSNEKQKELYDAKVASLGGNEVAARKLVAEPMPPLGNGRGSMHLKGMAIDINSKGDAGINTLAGNRAAPTGWLEKFGLTRPVPNEDWHIQPSGSIPAGDGGMVPGKDGKPTDPATGKAMPVPTDPSTGKALLNTSKSVDQLKKEQSEPGQTTIIVKNTTTNVTKVRGRDSN